MAFGNQDPVKRIIMEIRKQYGRLSHPTGQGQLDEPVLGHGASQVFFRGKWKNQAAPLDENRDFPGGDNGEMKGGGVGE